MTYPQVPSSFAWTHNPGGVMAAERLSMRKIREKEFFGYFRLN